MAKLFSAVILLAGVILATADDLEPCSLGLIAEGSDWPSVAQVEFKTGDVWVQQCAATVLTSYHVLSTANCFSGNLYTPESRRIRAGTSTSGSEGTIVGVVYAHIHPTFGLLGNDGDIAVVQVEAGMILDGVNIAQALVVPGGVELPPGLPVQLLSWGRTAQGYDETDADLYELTLYTHDNDDCLNKYLIAGESEIITENMICAGLSLYQGRDLDTKDLGAPIFYQNVVSGVISFGKQADDEYPVVATSVSSYTNWIVEVASSLVQP